MTAAPALREELRLLPAAPQRDGSPAWMIHDPVINRFYRIGWLDFELLLRWSLGAPQAILDSLQAETTLQAEPEDLAALHQFLQAHDLLQCPTAGAAGRLAQRAAANRPGALQWLLHHYLFIRIPLLRPQEALLKLASVLGFLFTPAAAFTLLALSALGVVLALRQWDTFAATFVDQLSWSGALGFGVALVVSKALHEMGHAVTASRYGVRVAHMGVAFLVLFPMLYTDTSESWKLRNPKQRLAIASAGIVTELALAGLATLAWSLTPDGALRNGLFFLATTGWLLTLAVNASPFMRFDGYFIACDLFDFPNLHERAGAQARTALRRRVLGLPLPWPETFDHGQRRILVGFASLTWVYRFVLYLSICLLVYTYFFKLLGIFLMLVEIWWFIMKPIHSELRAWRPLIKLVGLRQRLLWAAAGLLLAALLLLPWQTSVHSQGWLHPERQQTLYAPLPGRLLTLPGTDRVQQGQALFALESPDLRLAGERATAAAATREHELLGLAGMPDGEERRLRTTLELDRSRAEADLYAGQQQRLQIAAPFAGRVVDVDPLLAPGVWVHPRQALAMLIDPSQWVVDTYISESDLSRVRLGDKARVEAGAGPLQALEGQVVEIDAARVSSLPHRLLDSQYGGPIATVPGASGRADGVPRASLFRVRVRLNTPPAANHMALARVVIQGQSRSLLSEGLAHAGSVIVRESGF